MIVCARILVSFLLLYLQYTESTQVGVKNDPLAAISISSPPSLKQEPRRIRVVPIMFARSLHSENVTRECSNSIDEFPQFFTEEMRRNGAIIINIIVAVYCFTAIAIICDSYFLPCVERICEAFNLSQDVAAATFMSMATSAPELFVNMIGTFVTKSDIGIGTIVGSSLFNTLGVASIGGLAARTPIQLHWWPLTRDTSIYIACVLLLVSITWDNVVYWYEALVLFIIYFVYFTLMFQNERISKYFYKLFGRLRNKKVSDEPEKPTPDSQITYIDVPFNTFKEQKESIKEEETDGNEADINKLFKNEKKTWCRKLFNIYLWPIKFVLSITVPDCRKNKKVFPLTFIMCVLWIGSNSYLVSWMITIIGYTLGIQDSVLGLTFLAAGGCLPEAISITIMSRKGEGAMGVSNALGANTMNILLSLGFPWFLKTIINTDDSNGIRIESGSIEYTILALVVVAITLFLTLSCNKFRLSRLNGLILMTFYTIFIVLAITSEIMLENKDCVTLQR